MLIDLLGDCVREELASVDDVPRRCALSALAAHCRSAASLPPGQSLAAGDAHNPAADSNVEVSLSVSESAGVQRLLSVWGRRDASIGVADLPNRTPPTLDPVPQHTEGAPWADPRHYDRVFFEQLPLYTRVMGALIELNVQHVVRSADCLSLLCEDAIGTGCLLDVLCPLPPQVEDRLLAADQTQPSLLLGVVNPIVRVRNTGLPALRCDSALELIWDYPQQPAQHLSVCTAWAAATTDAAARLRFSADALDGPLARLGSRSGAVDFGTSERDREVVLCAALFGNAAQVLLELGAAHAGGCSSNHNRAAAACAGVALLIDPHHEKAKHRHNLAVERCGDTGADDGATIDRLADFATPCSDCPGPETAHVDSLAHGHALGNAAYAAGHAARALGHYAAALRHAAALHGILATVAKAAVELKSWRVAAVAACGAGLTCESAAEWLLLAHSAVQRSIALLQPADCVSGAAVVRSHGPRRGRCLVATRDVAPGEVVVDEPALLALYAPATAGDAASQLAAHMQRVCCSRFMHDALDIMAGLCGATHSGAGVPWARTEWRNDGVWLCAPPRCQPVLDVAHSRLVVARNAFEWEHDARRMAGVFPRCAMLNHDDAPNATRSFVGSRMVVVAQRAIAASEEICHAYEPCGAVIAARCGCGSGRADSRELHPDVYAMSTEDVEAVNRYCASCERDAVSVRAARPESARLPACVDWYVRCCEAACAVRQEGANCRELRELCEEHLAGRGVVSDSLCRAARDAVRQGGELPQYVEAVFRRMHGR